MNSRNEVSLGGRLGFETLSESMNESERISEIIH